MSLPNYITQRKRKRKKTEKIRPIIGLVTISHRPLYKDILGSLSDAPLELTGMKRQRYAKGLKEEGCCADCGEPDTVVLVFHHRKPSDKSFHIAEGMRNSNIPWKVVLAELEKCDILCANCHMRRHYG